MELVGRFRRHQVLAYGVFRPSSDAVEDEGTRLEASRHRPGGLLPSPWKGVDAGPLNEAMKEFFPVGTPVTAVYPTMHGLGSLKTFTSVITGVSGIDKREPSFHIKDQRDSPSCCPARFSPCRTRHERRSDVAWPFP